MIISLSWTDFKSRVSSLKRVRYIDRGSFYIISYQEVGGGFETSVLKDSGADQTDFEANYKPSANSLVDVPTTTLKTAETVKGHYWIEPVKISIPVDSTADVPTDFTWPFNVEVLSGAFFSDNMLAGDKIAVKAIIGTVAVLAADAASGATVLTLNSVAYVDAGYMVSFASDATRYMVKSVNTANNTITLNTALTASFVATDAVKLEVDFIHGALEVEPGHEYQIGEEAFGGSLLPTGKTLRITVTPLSGAARVLRGFIALLY
jgi:hypothetical protein